MIILDERTDDTERMVRRIHRILGDRHAMHIGELCMRLGMDKTAVETALDLMIARGEVERLRPIDCSIDDHDFFRLNQSIHLSVKATDERTTHVVQIIPYQARPVRVTFTFSID